MSVGYELHSNNRDLSELPQVITCGSSLMKFGFFRKRRGTMGCYLPRENDSKRYGTILRASAPTRISISTGEPGSGLNTI